MIVAASPTRIIILGAGKSGTSGLFHCVAQSAERHHACAFQRLFEPKTEDALASLSGSHAITKVLSERLQTFPSPEALLAGFGRRIMIVRDPRDTVVSRLLWLAATRIGEAAPEAASAFLDALASKEREPQSFSLLDLYRIAAPVVGFNPEYAIKARELAFLPIAILERHKDFHTLKYESFVERDLASTEAYLDFPLIGDFDLPPKAGRILRAGQQGGWENWFLDEDDAFFSISQAKRLERLGYSPLRRSPPAQRIDPQEATGYVARVQESIRRFGK
ncbi:hypothetical protein [Aestuariivirga sp.]|uniref:hypothetical protein n=1 Tax=Aestuariivirga sp. TaxID=2650926 RepID=UPI003593E29B